MNTKTAPAIAELRDPSVWRTLENFDTWRHWTRFADSIGRTQKREPVDKRFFRHVTRRGPNECWEWQATTTVAGHGQFSAGDIRTTAHRVAWAIENGNIPAGQVVRHECDNPPCCNPGHLLLGTQLENVGDSVSRERHSKGEIVGTSVLTEREVLQIRGKWETQKYSQDALAREFGVSQNTIHKVVRRVTWQHI